MAFDAERIGRRVTGRAVHLAGCRSIDCVYGRRATDYATASARPAFRVVLADYPRAAGATLFRNRPAVSVDARLGRVVVRQGDKRRTLRADLVAGDNGPRGVSRAAGDRDDGDARPCPFVRRSLDARITARAARAAGLTPDRRHDFVAAGGTPTAVALPTADCLDLRLTIDRV